MYLLEDVRYAADTRVTYPPLASHVHALTHTHDHTYVLIRTCACGSEGVRAYMCVYVCMYARATLSNVIIDVEC